MMTNTRANEIVREIKNKDFTNMSELYDTLKIKFSYISNNFYYSVYEEDKKELFHDALEKLFKNIDNFDESKCGFISYFSIISKRTLINFCKLKEIQMRDRIISNTYEKDGEEMILSDLCDNVNYRSCEDEVFEAYDVNSKKEAIINAIASLNNNYRRVWELIYKEGLKNEALAKRLGHPITKIENWYKRGKAKLANMQEIRALVSLEEPEREEENER